MRLQTQLTLAFAAVAVAPIAALSGVARRMVSDQYRGEFQQTLDDAEAQVEREYQRMGEDLVKATARVARADDPLLRPILVALARGALDDDQERDLAERAEGEMRALGFDVLTLLDEHGTVLAAGHFPGRAGDADPDAQQLARARAGQAQLADVQVVEGGRVRKRLALVCARSVEQSFPDGKRARVSVVAGRLVGAELVARLSAGGGDRVVRLLDPDGAPLLDAPPAHTEKSPAAMGAEKFAGAPSGEKPFGAKLPGAARADRLGAAGGEKKLEAPGATRVEKLAGALHVERAPAPAHGPRRFYDLKRADGSVAARVEITVSDAELERRLALIGAAAAALGVGGLALALLLGAIVARRWSVPLGRLADGARAVSRGELDTTVPVRGADEVGQLGAAFNTMTRDLAHAREELVRAERVAAWREIAQRIAHEIKNPLTPIQMAIETLQRAQAKGPQVFDALFAESAHTILDEVQRLKHIVAEFSSFARMPAPDLKRCAVGEVVEAALKLYAGAVPVERELEAELPDALADRDQLTQVLLNLLENAREAVGGGDGRIHVRTRRAPAGDRVELEVADTGPGIADEARAKLFTPYFTTKTRGTGLGLAIVHRIVSDHGGEIRVGGAPGQGAVFTVSLPRA